MNCSLASKTSSVRPRPSTAMAAICIMGRHGCCPAVSRSTKTSRPGSGFRDLHGWPPPPSLWPRSAFDIPDDIPRFSPQWQAPRSSSGSPCCLHRLTAQTRQPGVENSDRYGIKTSAVGNRIVLTAAVISSNVLCENSRSIPRRIDSRKMSLWHRSHSVNRNSPFRLRGKPYQFARDRPVELGASRGARPDRRRLVGAILLSANVLPSLSRRFASRVIPTFYPMSLTVLKLHCAEDGRLGAMRTARAILFGDCTAVLVQSG